MDILLVLIIAAILGGAIWYLRRAKKQGEICVGCPHCKQCSGKCGDCHPDYGYSNSKEARPVAKENTVRPLTRKE